MAVGVMFADLETTLLSDHITGKKYKRLFRAASINEESQGIFMPRHATAV